MSPSTKTRTRSREWYQRAQQSLIEGVNSPSRGSAVYWDGPVVLERGHGSHVWDLDGNEYVDFMMSFGALIQGHAHPKIVEVVSQTIAEGSHFAAATPAELDAAERFRSMVPGTEAVRFANSGSEAICAVPANTIMVITTEAPAESPAALVAIPVTRPKGTVPNRKGSTAYIPAKKAARGRAY